MILAISSRTIGSDLNLIFDGSEWSWSKNFPKESLLWGFEDYRDLRDAASSLKLDIPEFWNTPWGNAQSHVQKKFSYVKWQHALPVSQWKDIVTRLVDQLWRHFSCEDNSYYVSTHIRNRRITQGLSRPIVSDALCREKIDSAKNGKRGLVERFLPIDDGKPERSIYSFSNTVTGRMTIKKGPNILTLKKEDRNILKSRFKNGKLIEIDLQSAEPRVALSMFDKHIDGDIYSEIIKSLGMNITRDISKIATISALYGASHHALSSHVSNSSDAMKIIDSVKEYFGVRHLEKMIIDQHSENSYITNTHGRKIFSESASVNHLIQSSTVDVAFDVFELIIGKIKELKIDAVPVYIIHDAIIFDAREKDLEKIYKICEDGFVSKTVKTRFPVKIKEIE